MEPPLLRDSDGKPHLRIENALLAGPTIEDEVANAAFFGLMIAFGEELDDVRRVMDFDDAVGTSWRPRATDSVPRCAGSGTASALEMILSDLLPKAREGLEFKGIDSADIDRYIGVIERAPSGRTGAQWALDFGAHGNARYAGRTSLGSTSAMYARRRQVFRHRQAPPIWTRSRTGGTASGRSGRS